MDEYTKLAEDCGFTAAAPVDPVKLTFRSEVRDMCAADKCRSYNKSWACPPGCGTLEEIIERCAPYTSGLIAQSTAQLENSFDFEGIQALQERHDKAMLKMADALADSGADFLPMGAGTCTRCESCTWPDASCRFPDRVFPSMEACGLVVSESCTAADIPYYYGKDTMTFVGAFLFK